MTVSISSVSSKSETAGVQTLSVSTSFRLPASKAVSRSARAGRAMHSSVMLSRRDTSFFIILCLLLRGYLSGIFFSMFLSYMKKQKLYTSFCANYRLLFFRNPEKDPDRGRFLVRISIKRNSSAELFPPPFLSFKFSVFIIHSAIAAVFRNGYCR